MTYRPRVLVDFDGVIHKYSKGWHDGTAYDEPMEGAKDAIQWMMDKGYEVVVFSTREARQIIEWLENYEFPSMRVTNIKLPGVALIDDRAIRFTSWQQSLTALNSWYPVQPNG